MESYEDNYANEVKKTQNLPCIPGVICLVLLAFKVNVSSH